MTRNFTMPPGSTRSTALPAEAAVQAPVASPALRAYASAFAGALLGTALLLGVGFSQPALIHAVAHDVRHATGFPCH